MGRTFNSCVWFCVVVLIGRLTGSSGLECFRTFQQSQFPFCKVLSPSFVVHWVPTADSLTFAIEAEQVGGWIGFGLSEAGGMRASDMYVFQMDRNGNPSVVDYWSTDITFPVADTQQDIQLVGSPIVSDRTTAFVISRALLTCDLQDIIPLQGAQQSVVWAFGSTWGYHGTTNRGNSKLVLLPSSTAVDKVPPGTQSIALTTTLEVPAKATTYLCKYFALPAQTKYHVIAYEGVVASEYVHHMVLYQCIMRPPQLDLPAPGLVDCADMDMNCQSFMFAWAPGQEKDFLPAEAGVAIGAGSVAYTRLEYHLTNPSQLSGKQITAGMNLEYTSQLRNYDMGVLLLGSQSFAIPKGEPNYMSIPNLCPAECLSQKLSGPVTMVNNYFHMHRQGRTIVTQHIRKGVELPPLGARRAWDFDHQGPSRIPDATNQLLPGDSLLTTCFFDSTKANTTTRWGMTSDDEMCYNVVQYYPKLPALDFCITSFSNGALCTTTTNLLLVRSDVSRLPPKDFVVASFDNYNFTAFDPIMACKYARGDFTPGSNTGNQGFAQPPFAPAPPRLAKVTDSSAVPLAASHWLLPVLLLLSIGAVLQAVV